MESRTLVALGQLSHVCQALELLARIGGRNLELANVESEVTHSKPATGFVGRERQGEVS